MAPVLLSFYSPWKPQKSRCFLLFSGGIERHDLDYSSVYHGNVMKSWKPVILSIKKQLFTCVLKTFTGRFQLLRTFISGIKDCTPSPLIKQGPITDAFLWIFRKVFHNNSFNKIPTGTSVIHKIVETYW